MATDQHGMTGATGDMSGGPGYGIVELRGRIRTADPDDGSPGEDTWWIARDGASPEDVALKVRVDGQTYTLAPSGGNAFGTIAVSGQSNVVAEQANDTLTLAAGANVTLTTSAAGDSVTIAAAGSAPAAYKGAMVTKAADQTAANYTTLTAIAWDSEIYDTDGFHDNVTDNTRHTIPSGVTKVNITASVVVSLVTANDLATLVLEKGGSTSFSGAAGKNQVTAGTVRNLNITAIGVPVTAGEYFEVFLQLGADTSVTVLAARSFFTIQVVE